MTLLSVNNVFRSQHGGKWNNKLFLKINISGEKSAKKWQTKPSKPSGGYKRCSLDAGVCWKHLHHEPHRKLAADYYFPYLPFPQANWPPQTSQYIHSCILRTATPWGFTKQTNRWAGMGPPMVHHLLLGMKVVLLILSSHTESDRAMKIYIVLDLTLHTEGDQVGEQQLSIPSPGGGTWKLVQA